MVSICLQCGDEGAANAFIYCIHCLKYAVHRYCLDELPETLDEFVPWVCDDCEWVAVAQKVTSVLTRRQNQDQDRTTSKHVESSFKKQLLEGKTTTTQTLNASECTPLKLKQKSNNTNHKDIDHEHNELHSNKLKKRNPDSSLADASQAAGLEQEEARCSLLSKMLAQPLIKPIWRGSFNILNNKKASDDVDTLVVAHLSKKVGKQVFDEASLFPSMFELELHPKADVWPKRFQELKPSDDDIAIYFFPMSKRYEGVFDELVEEMMDDELALKAVTENAELLVFPSNELPLNFWRFQGKFFLWGVFRGKQAAT